MLVVVEVGKAGWIPVGLSQLSQHTNQRLSHGHTVNLRVTYEQFQTAISAFAAADPTQKHSPRSLHHSQSGNHRRESWFNPIRRLIALNFSTAHRRGCCYPHHMISADRSLEHLTSI
ncbi:MAG: hypothetical protein OXN96_03855 [Bryobacterales bacterium]|nr:hypothetical protein [Bryobacterales bacterium]